MKFRFELIFYVSRHWLNEQGHSRFATDAPAYPATIPADNRSTQGATRMLLEWVPAFKDNRHSFCRHLQIIPFVYLNDVIERISTHPAWLMWLMLELTPREWKRRWQDSGSKAVA